QSMFVIPLWQSAFLSSCAAAGMLVTIPWAEATSLAAGTAWLAVLWLVIAWREGWPGLFACFQIAISLSAVFVTTAWLRAEGRRLLDPVSGQIYAAALSVLGLCWAAARYALRTHAVAQRLLHPPWPAVDRVVLTLLVPAHLLLAWAVLTPGIVAELMPSSLIDPSLRDLFAGWQASPAAAPGWVLLALLALLVLI